MRNQHKLGVLFSEFDKLIALMDGLSALEPSNAPITGAEASGASPCWAE